MTASLHIDHVQSRPDMGLIGLSICPGKKKLEGKTEPHRIDMITDLHAICAWNAVAVLTLLEERDMHDLGVSDLGEKILSVGLQWFHLPIKDYGIPSGAFEKHWQTVSKDLHTILKAGDNILVHCNAGLGRSGTIAAKLLIELGIEAKDAVHQIRQIRPGAIETTAQLNYVMNLK